MEQVKHSTAAENSVKRYESPRSRVVFVKVHAVLCQSGLYEKELDPDDFE